MTPTNEDLLALAKIICAAMNGPSDYGWDDQSDQYRARCMDAALRVLVSEWRSRTRIGGDASVAVCPICDIAGCHHIRDAGKAALDVSETPVSDQQQDLLLTTEQQAIRDKALDDAAQAASNRAAFFRDAAETASEAGFHALRAFHAMRELCLVEIAAAIRAMKGKPE